MRDSSLAQRVRQAQERENAAAVLRCLQEACTSLCLARLYSNRVLNNATYHSLRKIQDRIQNTRLALQRKRGLIK